MGRLTDVLLAEVIRSSLGGDGQRELVALRDPQIGAALRLMHDRPEEGWTVERLASKVSMSRSAFANRFREVTGQPPMRYLTRHRLALAARLLRDGNASVWEVARRTGYQSEAALSRAFKREFGLSPGRYRRAKPRESSALLS